jgi:hypothetical protein
MSAHPFRNLSPFAFAAALAGCSDVAPPPSTLPSQALSAAAARPLAATDEAALVDEIAATLQACSYDGSPVRIGADRIGPPPSGDCRDMVAKIMQFTGLPQNFDVMEAPVPNAAAVIVLDEKKLPRRVIAFNGDFMDVVSRATGGNAWAPVSIMAHEIGHHLSGHTITPGGSQPPTELEADKFSGFVLYKMGASLPDAQKAMATLVADGPDGSTHPGRGKRLAAIEEGWQQACVQQGGGECRGVLGMAQRVASADDGTPPPVISADPAPVAETVAARQPVEVAVADAQPTVGAHPTATSAAHVVPAPGSTPSKFSQFVYDEFGLLDPAGLAEAERRMFGFARDSGVEVVTLLVKDLHGMSARDYAYAMMRQLRVGKLDVGNGAVVVVAPVLRESAIAIGPGLLIEVGNLQELNLASLETFIEDAWPVCTKYGNCKGWTENFFLASDRIARSGRDWEWTVRYPSLAEMKAVHDREFAERMDSGNRYEPSQSLTWRKIARFSGTVVSLAPDPEDRAHFVNDKHAEMVGPAVLVRSDDGIEAMLYVHPHAQGLMPAGKLVEGARYGFVIREHSLYNDTPQLDLLSYDALDGA